MAKPPSFRPTYSVMRSTFPCRQASYYLFHLEALRYQAIAKLVLAIWKTRNPLPLFKEENSGWLVVWVGRRSLSGWSRRLIKPALYAGADWQDGLVQANLSYD